MELRRRIIFAMLLLVVVTSLSVLGYRLLGGPSVTFLEALYMAVITLAGVGYGEIVDTSHIAALRLFNIFVVLFGVMITAYVFSSVTAFLVEGDYSDVFRRRKMLKKIQQLKNHFIVCGLGDTGRHAIDELQKTGSQYVVIETHDENIKRLKEHTGDTYKDLLYVVGDATDEEVLEQAGVGAAAGLLSTLANDKENLVITVLVRQKNPNIRIVARCTDLKFSERMQKAGADSVVSPNRIGGLRLASEILRPHVVGFLDLMLKEQSRTLRIEDLVIPHGSPWTGKSLGALDLRGHYNLMPMALKNAGGDTGQNFWVNPPDTISLKGGIVIIVMGDVGDIRRARAEAGGESVFTATADV
ncbi:MAG TPA: potassium channel protein [Terriglobales bacterium]|nr:potassium channel protein [Terriglobales bacterium]